MMGILSSVDKSSRSLEKIFSPFTGIDSQEPIKNDTFFRIYLNLWLFFLKFKKSVAIWQKFIESSSINF